MTPNHKFPVGSEVRYVGSLHAIRGEGFLVSGACDCHRHHPTGTRHYKITGVPGGLLLEHVREASLRGYYTRLPASEKREAAVDMRGAGQPVEVIAATLGISLARVHTYTR